MIGRIKIHSFAFALILSGASLLQASDTTFVYQGARVKAFPAQPGAKAITGNVANLAFDTLIVLPEGGGEALTFDPRDLRKIEVSQGKKGNALLGLGVGAGVGIASAVGLAIWACNADDDGCTSGQVAGGALALSAIGAGLGAGIGALIKTERWRDASIPASPPPVGLGFGKDGSVRLAFSLRL
jgi:hypothetical protein